MGAINKQDKVYICIASILIFLVLFFYFKSKNKENFINAQYEYIQKLEKELNYYKTVDSSYVIKRDSIEYNIIKRDSVIINIIKRYEDEKDKVLSSSDSSVVNKFNELVWAD